MKEKMNYNEMKDEELTVRIKALGDEYFAGQQKVRTGQFKRFSEFGRIRKEIARIRTHLRSRQLKTAQTQTAKK